MGSQSGVYYRIQRSYVLIDQILTSNLKAAKIDHVLPALTFLDTCLRDVLALIIKRGKKRTAVQLPVDALMGKSSKVRAEIASAENTVTFSRRCSSS